jgi:drug/metabolite transporter (DMT)-like permease
VTIYSSRIQLFFRLIYSKHSSLNSIGNKNLSIQSLPFVVLLGFLYGSTLIASRFSVGQYDPTTYIGLRMLIASLAHFFVYAIISGKRLPRDIELWKRAGILGVVGTAIPMTSVVASLQYQSTGVSSLMLTTVPALTVVIAHFVLPDESLTLRKIIGVTLALGGAIMLALSGENGLPDLTDAPPTGYILITIAIIFSSAMTIYARKYLKGYDSFDVASIRIFTAALTIMPFSLFAVGFDMSQVTSQGYLALIYAAIIGTFFGLLLSFYNIKRFGATPAVMTSYIIPIVAGLGGVLVLGEEFTSTMIFGMIVIIAGVALLQEFQQKKVVVGKPHI